MLDLYNADNNIHLYALTGDKTFKKRYVEQISSVATNMQKVKLDSKQFENITAETLNDLLGQKNNKQTNT